MIYCKKCVMPNTRPGVIIEDDGICNYCKVAEEKKNAIDWDAKEKELATILDKYKGENGTNYDCLIPVSGGKDSTWQVITMKEKYGMNPLLYSFSPCKQTPVGAKNFQNIIHLGFDMVNITTIPITYKKLMLEAFKRTGEPCLFCHYGVFAGAVQAAIRHKIQLIIWGESGIEYGLDEDGFYDEGNLSYIDMGMTPEDFVGDDIKVSDLNLYIYPSIEEIKKANIRQICLGSYIKYDIKEQLKLIKSRGFTTHDGPWLGTYSNHENLDCSFGGVHDYLGYLKFGYGRATNHASQDIRAGLLSREEAVELVRKYDGKYDNPIGRKYFEMFLEFVGITKDEFDEIAERFRNEDIWEKQGDKWVKKFELV